MYCWVSENISAKSQTVHRFPKSAIKVREFSIHLFTFIHINLYLILILFPDKNCDWNKNKNKFHVSCAYL